MAQVIKDIVTWLKDWFYTEQEVDDIAAGLQSQINNKADTTTVSSLSTTVSGKANSVHTHGNIQNDGVLKVSGTAQASKSVCTDANGNITAEAKNNHTHNYIPNNADGSSTGYITAKGFKVSGKSNFLKADGTTADANNYSHPTYTSKTNGLYKITVDGTGHVSGTTSVGSSDLPSHTHPDTQLNWNGSTTSNSISPLLMATGEEWNANRLAYFPPENIIIETSTNGGSTWTTQGTSAFSNANRTKLVTTTSSTVYCGMGSTTDYSKNQLRITLDMGNVDANSVLYMVTRKIALYTASSNASGFKAQLSTQTYAQYSTNQNTFTNVGSAFDLVGWSGWNTAPINVTLGGYSGGQTNSSSDRIKRLRITFTQTGGTGNGGITKIRLYGETAYIVPSQLGINGHMYTYDENKNVTFPSNVTASKFIKNSNSTNLLLSNGNDLAQSTFATSGHNHNATAIPLVDSYTGAVGTSTLYARQDHIHPIFNNTCANINNTDWYLKVMTIKVNSAYSDKALAFDLFARRPRLHHVELSFVNEAAKTDGSIDPQVRKFIVKGGDSQFWIARSNVGTWDIYVKKQEAYDGINITNLQYANNFTITYPNTVHSSLPTTNIMEALYERDSIGINWLQKTKEFTHGGNTSTIDTGLYNGCVVKKFNGNNSSYQDFSWDVPKEHLELGGVYTLSFWAKTTTSHGYVRTYFYQSNITSKRLKSNGLMSDWTEGSAYGDGATQFYVSHGWTRYYVTYQLLDTGTFNSNKKIAIRLLSNSNASQDLFIAGVKFEKGNQATKYSESPFDAKLTASQSVATDASGNIITESKSNHGHGKLSSGGVINYDTTTAVNKVVVTDTSNNLRTSSTIPTTLISNEQKYNNIKSGESTTLTLTNQKLINDAINTKIGSLPTTNTTYTAGTNLSLSGTQFNHSTSGVGNALTTAALKSIKYDSQGHITGVANPPTASTTGSGIVQLNDNVNNTSTTQAATANAVKKTYDEFSTSSKTTKNGHVHGNITSAGAIGSTSGKVITTGDSGVLQASDISSLGLISNTVTSFKKTDLAIHNAIGGKFTDSSYIQFWKIGKLVVAYFRVVSNENLTTSYETFTANGYPISAEYRPVQDMINLTHCHYNTSTPSILTTWVTTAGLVKMRINTSTRQVDTYVTMVWVTS